MPGRLPARLRLTVIAGIVAATAFGSPGPGTDGAHLTVLVCLVLALLGGTGWAASERGDGWAVTGAFVAIAGAGAALTGVAPNTAGVALTFVALVAAGARLPAERSATVCLLAICTLIVATVATDASIPAVFAYTAGYVASVASANTRHQSVLRLEQSEVLLARVQRSREEQLRAAALEERARIAREIHDVLAHSLAGLAVQLEATRGLVAAGAEDGRVLERLDRARGLARDGLDEARRAVGTLRGDPVGLADRLEALLRTHRDATDAPAALHLEGDLERLAPDAALTVVRTVQEALTNVRKHAPGAAVDVALDVNAAQTRLRIGDVPLTGGTPVPASPVAASGGGYGLVGMRERAEGVGGTVTAGPDPDGGFTVTLDLPGRDA